MLQVLRESAEGGRAIAAGWERATYLFGASANIVTGAQGMSLPVGSSVSVFAYGSNMLTARIRERAPSARAVAIGHLTGYQLCWNKRSRLDGSGKCSVSETGQQAHVVWGVVFEMGVENKPNLDRAEGLGQGYGERVVKVNTEGGQLAVTMYYATSISPGIRPYDWYRELVVGGAREHRLPEEYVRTLETVEVMKDSDEDRAAINRRLLVRGLG